MNYWIERLVGVLSAVGLSLAFGYYTFGAHVGWVSWLAPLSFAGWTWFVGRDERRRIEKEYKGTKEASKRI